MRSRLTRLGLVALGLSVLSGATPPPAQAFTDGAAVFVGTVTATAGLDYPCAQFVSTTGGGSLPCPPAPPGVACLPLSGTVTGAVPNCRPTFAHNTQAVSGTSTTCVGIGVNVQKPLPPVTGPTCTFTFSGFIEGYCGFAGGQINGLITSDGHSYTFGLHFTNVSGFLVGVGHYTNPADGHHGKLVGVVLAFPPGPPGVTPESCLNKTARNVAIVGVVSGAPELVL